MDKEERSNCAAAKSRAIGGNVEGELRKSAHGSCGTVCYGDNLGTVSAGDFH